jgi:hypothetical protein
MATPSVTGSVYTYDATGLSATHSLSDVVVPSDADLVIVATSGNTSLGAIPSTVSWNGNALTKIEDRDNTDGVLVTLWELLSPTPGTGNLVTTHSQGPGAYSFAVFSLRDVDTASHRGTVVERGGEWETTSTLNVPAVVDDLVVDVYGKQITGISADASQTELFTPALIGLTADREWGVSTEVATSTSVAMSWSSASGQRSAHIGVAYKGATASGPTLTSGTVTSQTTDGFTLGFTTDTANGTAYYVVYPTTSTAPSAAQIVAGTDGDGVAAVASGNKVVSAAAAQTFPVITGLAPGTTYAYSILHQGTPA